MSEPIVPIGGNVHVSVGIVYRVEILFDRDPTISVFHCRIFIKTNAGSSAYTLGTVQQRQMCEGLSIEHSVDSLKQLEGKRVWVEFEIFKGKATGQAHMVGLVLEDE